MSIYRQSIFDIDISNRASRGWRALSRVAGNWGLTGKDIGNWGLTGRVAVNVQKVRATTAAAAKVFAGILQIGRRRTHASAETKRYDCEKRAKGAKFT